MKIILQFFLAVFFAAVTLAQAPARMSYQSVVRNGNNIILSNVSVGMRISILQGTATGVTIYAETQSQTTNVNGLVSLRIGSGNVITGLIDTIKWSNGPYFVKTEIDPTGGTNYTIVGTQEINSVPYALYAASAPSTSLDLSYDNNGKGQGRTITADSGALKIAGTDGLLVTGTFGSGANAEVTGAGTRMFFNPKKAAFRAGQVDGNQWDNSNIGANSIGMGVNTIATGISSITMGQSSEARSDYSIAIGRSDSAYGFTSIAVGGWRNNASGNYSTTVGGINNKASGTYSATVGGSQNSSSGNSSTVLGGNNNKSQGIASIAGGANSEAQGSYTIALGESNIANGVNSVAIGASDSTYGYLSIAAGGLRNKSGGDYSSILGGADNKVNGNYSTTIGGSQNSSSGNFSAVIGGKNNKSLGDSTIAGGTNSEARGFNAIAIGQSNIANAVNSIAIGKVDSAYGSSSIAAGGWRNKAAGDYSSILGGVDNKANGNYSATVGGNQNTTSGNFSAVIGGKNNKSLGDSTIAGGTNSEALGINAIAIGQSNIANGSNSIAIGSLDSAYGSLSITAGGWRNKAVGDYSSIIGGKENKGIGNYSSILGGRFNQALGTNSAVIAGYTNKSSGLSSIAGGENSNAFGDYSIALGQNSFARGISSISIGKDNVSWSNFTMSIGYNCYAGSLHSLAIGNSNYASGNYSSAIGGYNSYAFGDYSIAIGTEVNCNSQSELAVGAYNTNYTGSNNSWSTSDRLFVIGNGTSNTNRSDALVLLKNGNLALGGGSLPSYTLDLIKSAPGSYAARFYNSGNTTTSSALIVRGGDAAGTTGTLVRLERGNGNISGIISFNNGGISYASVSDRRLKQNIVDTKRGLSSLEQIRIKDYQYKSNPENTVQGVIAQELYEIYPQAVTKGSDELDENGNPIQPWAVDYGKLTPLIIQSIQELKNLIENKNSISESKPIMANVTNKFKVSNSSENEQHSQSRLSLDIVIKTLFEQKLFIESLSKKNENLTEQYEMLKSRIEVLEKYK